MTAALRYRMVYIREDRVRGFLFTAASAEQAHAWAQRQADRFGATLLTVNRDIGRPVVRLQSER